MDGPPRHAACAACRIAARHLAGDFGGPDYGKDPDAAWANLRAHERAYVARYALGRDYHKLMRNRLQKLAEVVQAEIGPFGHRAFTDSAPVLSARWRAMPGWAGLANTPA